MSNSLSVTGKLIVKYDTQQVSDKYRKREFVIETSEEVNGQVYKNFAKFQLAQNRCDILDRFKIDDTLTIHFNLRGNKWEKDGKINYLTNLDAWKLEAATQTTQEHGTPSDEPIF